MAGPNWSDDASADANRIVQNAHRAADDARRLAEKRADITDADVKRWHTALYDGCAVPSPAYVGRFRGEPHPDVADYEVGIGALMPDGYPDRVGVWAADVPGEVAAFLGRLKLSVSRLDAAIPAGERPHAADVLHEVIAVIAATHGEWVRIHPFVNGNGRTARLLTAHIALRYGLPVFVTLKPRPHDVAYARASRRSMGRPPTFTGDHTEATAVFTHLLALHLLES